MTEEEARQRWCPMARVGSLGGMHSGWNRPESESFGHREKIGGENHCIASACMAWRTKRESHYYNAHGGLEEGPRLVGYCGLAGALQ